MSWYQQSREGLVLHIRVMPRAPRDAVDGVLGDALKIRLTAPPVEGKANQALIRFLSDALNLPRGQMTVLAGETSRNKRVLVSGATVDAVRSLLR